MMNHSVFPKIFFLLILVISAASVALPASADISVFGTRIACDPVKPPSQGGCNFYHFVAALKATFDFLLKLALPLAGVFIVWGGVTIMTAGGSESRYSKGKSILTYAVVGLVIVLGAWLIIYTIYYILGVGLNSEGKRITDVLFPGKSFNQ